MVGCEKLITYFIRVRKYYLNSLIINVNNFNQNKKMNNSNSKIYGVLYIIGMCLCLSGIYIFKNHLVSLLSIGALILIFPWIALLREVIKTPIKNRSLWIWCLIMHSAIAIPIYLLTRKNRLKDISQTK